MYIFYLSERQREYMLSHQLVYLPKAQEPGTQSECPTWVAVVKAVGTSLLSPMAFLRNLRWGAEGRLKRSLCKGGADVPSNISPAVTNASPTSTFFVHLFK